MGNFIKKNILLIIAFSFIFIGFGFPYIVKVIFKSQVFNGLGSMGDWFGGFANPIIGVASFLLVFAAFKLQQEQSSEQNRTLGLQRFETTFFQLLTFQHNITERLKISYQNNKSEKSETVDFENLSEHEELIINTKEDYLNGSGKDFFMVAMRILKIYYDKEISKSTATNLKTKEKALINSYKKFYDKHQDYLGHYFRNLYHIAKYVSNTELINTQEKITYLGIYRAQLSAYEQILLLYNCSVKGLGFPKFRDLVIKHDLLQNMNNELLIDSDHLNIFNDLDK